MLSSYCMADLKDKMKEFINNKSQALFSFGHVGEGDFTSKQESEYRTG